MALASATSAVRRHLRNKEIIIKVTATGNYVAGGDTLNLAANVQPVGMSDANFGFPGDITDYSVGNVPTGFAAQLVPGTNLTNWKMKVLQTGAGLSGPFAELAAAAYPTAAKADTYTLHFSGPKLRL
jgi:hypothetical protein